MLDRVHNWLSRPRPVAWVVLILGLGVLTFLRSVGAAEPDPAHNAYILGQAFYYGEEIPGTAYARLPGNGPRDYRTAAELYRKAAKLGHVHAQYQLATMYIKGLGVTLDPSQAVHWFRKAAFQGHVASQASLAMLYAAGWGVPQEDGVAYAWLLVAMDRDAPHLDDLRLQLLNRMSRAEIAAAEIMARGMRQEFRKWK